MFGEGWGGCSSFPHLLKHHCLNPQFFLLFHFWFYPGANGWLGSAHHDRKVQSEWRTLLRQGQAPQHWGLCPVAGHAPLLTLHLVKKTLSTPSRSFTSLPEFLPIHVHPALECCHIVLIANSLSAQAAAALG